MTRSIIDAEIKRLLDEYYTTREAELWLRSPHPQLDGETPNSLIERGDDDVVLQVLERLDSGVFL